MKIIEKLISLEKEATAFGFNWLKPEQILDQIQSEVREIAVHLVDKDQRKLQEEIGDLLHAVFSLCIFCGLDPEETLVQSINKFERRFKRVKEIAQQEGYSSLKGLAFDELMHFWDQAKRSF